MQTAIGHTYRFFLTKEQKQVRQKLEKCVSTITGLLNSLCALDLLPENKKVALQLFLHHFNENLSDTKLVALLGQRAEKDVLPTNNLEAVEMIFNPGNMSKNDAREVRKATLNVVTAHLEEKVRKNFSLLTDLQNILKDLRDTISDPMKTLSGDIESFISLIQTHPKIRRTGPFLDIKDKKVSQTISNLEGQLEGVCNRLIELRDKMVAPAASLQEALAVMDGMVSFFHQLGLLQRQGLYSGIRILHPEIGPLVERMMHPAGYWLKRENSPQALTALASVYKEITANVKEFAQDIQAVREPSYLARIR